MHTLDSIKNQLSIYSFLSDEQSVQIKGGEDKRDPRPGSKPSTAATPPQTGVCIKPR